MKLVSTIEVRKYFFYFILKMPLVKGFCHEDFKAAKDLFESNFLSGEDENAQICVYIGNQLVIDLWGVKCENNANNYGPDSLQVKILIHYSI